MIRQLLGSLSIFVDVLGMQSGLNSLPMVVGVMQ